MAALPRILTCRSAADVQATIRAALGTTDDYAPTHLIGASIRAGVAYDTIGSWHLYSDLGDAARVQLNYGSGGGTTFVTHGMATRFHSQATWRARDISHFNFSTQAFAFLCVARWTDGGGNGGWIMSNLDGPDAADPWLGNGTDYGPNRGYGISANENGGIGWSVIGDAGNLNQDTYDPNDGSSTTANTADLRTASHNIVIAGRVFTGTAGIYHAGYDQAAWSIGSGGTVGDVTSPTPFGLWHNYFITPEVAGNSEWARIIVFEGTAAENLVTNRAAIATALQATLE